MHDTNALQTLISQGLNTLDIPAHPANLYGAVQYMLQIGGKRVRPLLTLMAADLFGSRNLGDALPAALAIELFHNFSLVHDDLMDNAPLRRGQQTVHERWHPNTAILSGDHLLIMAYTQLSKCPLDKLPRLLDTFNQTAAEVCEGQQLDMDFERISAVGIDDYLEMIRLKTSVLLGAALKLGAIIADADQEDTKHIYDFGVNVGIAFQLQDDILDVYGDPEQFGKQQGGDIIANKKTYLLTTAFATADDDTRLALNRWLSERDHTASKVEAVTAIYDQLGVRETAEKAKQHYIQQAYRALDAVKVDQHHKLPLHGLAEMLLNRDH